MPGPTIHLASVRHRRHSLIRFDNPFASNLEDCHPYKSCPSTTIWYAHLLMGRGLAHCSLPLESTVKPRMILASIYHAPYICMCLVPATLWSWGWMQLITWPNSTEHLYMIYAYILLSTPPTWENIFSRSGWKPWEKVHAFINLMIEWCHFKVGEGN